MEWGIFNNADQLIDEGYYSKAAADLAIGERELYAAPVCDHGNAEGECNWCYLETMDYDAND